MKTYLLDFLKQGRSSVHTALGWPSYQLRGRLDPFLINYMWFCGLVNTGIWVKVVWGWALSNVVHYIHWKGVTVSLLGYRLLFSRAIRSTATDWQTDICSAVRLPPKRRSNIITFWCVRPYQNRCVHMEHVLLSSPPPGAVGPASYVTASFIREVED